MKNENAIETLINAKKICFLSSVNHEGFPVTRAMLKPIEMENGIFYLHTNTSSNKVQEFLNNSKACIYFCDDQSFQGVTLLGNMEVMSNNVDKQKFWKDEYSVYYSKGEGLSDFTVLKFSLLSGKYYHDFEVEEL
jgi:general stress protein 26